MVFAGYIDPARQRSGLGSRPMATAEDHARKAGCHAVDLRIVNPRREYAETGTEPFPQDPKPKLPCHCIIMSKRLPRASAPEDTSRRMPAALEEAISRRAALKEVEVRFAPAVRCPEASERDGRASRHPNVPCPLMLPTAPVMAIPDLFYICVRLQVVNVPVGAGGRSQMMRKPGTDASGA